MLAKDKLIKGSSNVEERATSEEPGAADLELAEPRSKTPHRESSSCLGSVLEEILEQNEREDRSVSTGL